MLFTLSLSPLLLDSPGVLQLVLSRSQLLGSLSLLQFSSLSLSYRTLSLSQVLQFSLSLLLDSLSLESYSALSLFDIWQPLTWLNCPGSGEDVHFPHWVVCPRGPSTPAPTQQTLHVILHAPVHHHPPPPPHNMAHSFCHAPNLALNAFWPPQQTLPACCMPSSVC